MLNRRQFIAGAVAGGALPLRACHAQAIGRRFTPEAFGAVGDGVTDDYAAFVRLAKAVNEARGGAVALAPSRTYLLDRMVTKKTPVADIAFVDCGGLSIEGNGATISVKGDFLRDQAATRGLAGLVIRDCRQVSVRQLSLNGNVDRTRRSGKMPEPASHGLIFQSCSDVSLDGVHVHHFAGDGLYIRESKRPDPLGLRQASRRFTVRNSRFLYNGRQGLSVIQLRGGVFENCDFSYTGFIGPNGALGSYGSHSPGAGVDVEPNNTPLFGDRVDVITGDLHFRHCRMIGNYGAAFVACKFARGQRFLEQVTLENCELECGDGLTGGRDGFIFDVPGGTVSNSTLNVRDKVAYLGWYPDSDASPRFAGNTVIGRNRRPGFPLLVVRATRGAPVVEDNRFVDRHPTLMGAAARAWLLAVNNPRAAVRNNRFILGAAA